MRRRHFPRLCRSCQAPLARQESSCWHCDTVCASEAEPRTHLRVIAGGMATQATQVPAAAVTAGAAGHGGSAGAAPWTWTGQ
ncbi:hypothetical protein DSM104329_03193 [Capillimicrobium parvum]|uniref:Uncharacterized protein n=1 Tax=Capillimicrobium parvum TaxID=2884022 RepID=A0A9E6XYB3_9ACTN|nr:hypothetical protein DSM104329_03193 [Capillimicrobium parvum]